MQPCITVSILVLQAEGLVRRYCYVGFTLQFTPIVIIPESNQITFIIGHLSWDADLVAVEVVGLLAAFSVFVVRYCGSGSWYGCSCSRSCVWRRFDYNLPLLWFFLRHRSSLFGYRFDHSGSSGLVGPFHLLRWSCCVAMLRVRSGLGWCGYRQRLIKLNLKVLC